MAYTEQTQYNAVNFTPAASSPAVFGQPRVIKGITIHHWGSTGQNFNTVRDYLASPNTRQVSAHYVAEGGTVACLVAPENVAWHAGNATGNATTIGIECRPEATDADYATVAELVANLRSVYGNLPLYPHSYWTSTACPGAWGLDRINALAGNPSTPTTPPVTPPVTPPTTPSGSISDLADRAMRGEFGNGQDRINTLGSNYDAVQAEINRRAGISTPTPTPSVDINALADAVLRGEYGNGDDRVRALGANYDAVQAEVNRRAGIGAPAPQPAVDINALADAVIRGDYGNGAERQAALGANYDAVQAEVNRRYS